MNSYYLGLVAGGAVIGAILGQIFGRYMKTTGTRLAVKILPIFVYALLVPALVIYAEKKFFPRTPVDIAIKKHAKTLADDPDYKEATKDISAMELQAFTQEKTRAGLKRLSDNDLIMWNSLRLKLAEADKEMCTGLWTGQGLSTSLVLDTLNKMDVESVDKWFAISMRAAIHEIKQTEFLEPDQTILAGGFKYTLEKLQGEDEQRFEKVMNAVVSAEKEEACWGLKVLLKETQTMPAELQVPFIRILSSI
ncbi:MAG: hypothetical protein IT287_05755 [Bdellovibrionaceae bacterium]|nr:hypothetical protein [Pseudobdellovibrionaceae bacterium]